MTDIIAEGNELGSLSEGELLRHIADRIETLNDLVMDVLEVQFTAVRERADHADEVAHEVQRQVTAITTLLEQHKPLLDRLADPSAAIRAFFTPRGRHAVREDGQGSLPVPVRQALHGAAGPRLLRDRRVEAQAPQEEGTLMAAKREPDPPQDGAGEGQQDDPLGERVASLEAGQDSLTGKVDQILGILSKGSGGGHADEPSGAEGAGGAPNIAHEIRAQLDAAERKRKAEAQDSERDTTLADLKAKVAELTEQAPEPPPTRRARLMGWT